MSSLAEKNASPMDPSEQLLQTINSGLEVLDQERRVFLEGRYAELAGIATAKQGLLDEIEDSVQAAPRSVIVVEALGHLIRAGRQNEALIKAAREGLAHAKRRIASILSTRTGAVAYAEDGTRIASTADLGEQDKSA